MLAKSVEGDVADGHQVVALVLVQCPADDLSWIYAITVRQVSERFGRAPRTVGEALTIRPRRAQPASAE